MALSGVLAALLLWSGVGDLEYDLLRSFPFPPRAVTLFLSASGTGDLQGEDAGVLEGLLEGVLDIPLFLEWRVCWLPWGWVEFETRASL